MWTAAFIGFVVLVFLIAVPIQTIGAAVGAYAGFQLGYNQVGQGAGIAAAIFGFFAGIAIGNDLQRNFLPRWKPGVEEAFGLALITCFTGAILVALALIAAFIIQTWSTK